MEGVGGETKDISENQKRKEKEKARKEKENRPSRVHSTWPEANNQKKSML